MADFIEVNVFRGGKIYLSKFGISYFARLSEEYTVVKFIGDRDEEHNSIQIVETPEEILKGFAQ
jgi:hypothetical protein